MRLGKTKQGRGRPGGSPRLWDEGPKVRREGSWKLGVFRKGTWVRESRGP